MSNTEPAPFWLVCIPNCTFWNAQMFLYISDLLKRQNLIIIRGVNPSTQREENYIKPRSAWIEGMKNVQIDRQHFVTFISRDYDEEDVSAWVTTLQMKHPNKRTFVLVDKTYETLTRFNCRQLSDVVIAGF